VSYFHSGKYDEAIATYTEAIRLNPGAAEAYENRGLAYKSQGKLREAKADFAKAERLRKDGRQ
jgi:tetratricopeptide (TPR) repeat protein